MKKRLLYFVTILLVLFSNLAMVHRVNAQTFVHPGAPLSKSDLDILKAHVKAGDYPWKQAYDIMAADGGAQLTYKMAGPFATVTRSPDVNLWPWRADMMAAFKLSLMWYFTGNENYAAKARDILVAWATTETSFGGQLGNLDLGDYAYAYGGAASILRGTWSGWTAANTTAVQNLFNNVYWPASGCSFYAIGPSNKGNLSMSAGVVIAAFSDDPDKMAHIVYLARNIAACGLKNTLPNGQNGESLRDQGHAHGTFNNLAFTAEVLYKQGIDIYSDLEDRIMANAEYFAKKNLSLPIQFIPFGTIDAYYLTDVTTPWDQGRFGPTLAHGAYIVRKKQNSVYLNKLLNNIPRRFDPVITWFYKSEDNSTATIPAQTEIVSVPTKVGTGGLTSLDIGTASPAGSSSYNNNVWTVKGSGDVWTHGADALHFVYKQVTGNCSIIAKVESVGGTTSGAKAGLMIRSDLTSTSAQRAWIAVTPLVTAESFMHGWSELRGGSYYEKESRPIPSIPYWVKIERVGEMIATYYSPDGTSWAAANEGRYTGFTGNAYIGLAVCGNSGLNTATFSNVSVTGGQGGVVTTPAAPHSVYAYPGDNQMRVRWLSSFGAESYTLKRASSESGPYTTIASNVSGNIFMDTSASNGQTYYYKVCAVNAAGTSADSPSDAGTPEAPPVPQILGSNGLNGIYRIIATHSNKAVEVKNASTAEGALLGQNTYSSLSNQHWVITPISGTDYKITNLLSGKAMDVVGNAKTNGAGIEQRSYSATDSAQVWSIKDKLNGTFNIVGKQSQKALEVASSSTLDGAAMDLNAWLDNPNQIFRIELVTASDMSAAYLKKLAEAIKLRDTTQTSTSNEGGKFPVAAKVQLNDSITYVQSLYNPQSAVVQMNGYVTILENAIERYKAAMYYYTNTLADGNYYLKPFGSDSLWTRNETNKPLFDTSNPNPLVQMWNVTKQGNGRYKITCLSAPPSAFSNYIYEDALFGRNVIAYSDAYNSFNIYFNGTSHAVQRAQSAGNGYWYKSGNQILAVLGSNNDPVPYTFPFRFVPVGTVPISLTAAASDGKNMLEWDPIANFTYNIKRSTTPGGPYTTIATVSTPAFADTTVSSGTSYYYVVASPDGVASSSEVLASRNVGKIYLKFDETSGARCVSSWGTTYGTLAATAARDTGKAGNALKLDGTSTSYATLPTGIMSTVTDFTVSAWVKMSALANWMRVFDFGTGTTQYMYLTVQGGTTTANGVTLSTVKYGIKNGGAELSVTSPYAFPLNTWVHLAITQSGNTAKLYINGVLKSTNTALTINPSQLTPTGATTGTNLNYLGKSQFADPMFKGSIDEFKIYKRALSASEIAQGMKVFQTITFNTLAPKLIGDDDFDPAATASSGLPVEYTSSNPSVAAIVDGNVHILSAGTTIITASQAGDDVYGAMSESKTLVVAITNNTQLTALLNRPFTYTITNKPLSNFTATGLPAGLSVNAVTGVISGTPTAYGTFPIVIGAVNDTIPSTQTITLTVQNNAVNNVIVAAGDAKNILEWDPMQNVTYNIKRSTTSGGSYTTIGSTGTTRFTDSNVSNGTIYYYVVAAVDNVGEMSPSQEVVAKPNIGQVTCLKFDEANGMRGIDSWGANHGTLAATATRSVGRNGQALKLDGTPTAYATLPSGIVKSLSDYTISAWVKMDALATWMRVFDFGTGTTKYMFLSVQSAVGQVRFAIKNGGTEQNVTSNYTVPLNTWTHFAITQSGNTCSMYINGTLAATNTGITIKPSAIDSTTLNYLGKSQFSDPMFKGSIDEFKIYSRALSASEIAASYLNQTITINSITTKLMGDADFDPAATASSGLPVTYSSSDTTVAKIVNGKVHILTAGTSTITASQNGNNVYWPAPSQTKVLSVVITNNTQPTTLIGRPFTYTITTKPLSNFTAIGLPAGLSINSVTGVISGTPTVYGTFPVTLTASNGSSTGTQIITLTVQNIVVSNVIVAAGDAKNIVQWDPIQNLTFNVKRSTTSGGPYTTLGNVSTTRFTDSNVSNGISYYYIVVPVDSIGETTPSAEVVALPNVGQVTYLKFDEASGTRAIDSWGATDGTLAATATRNTGKYVTSLKLDGTATSYATLPTGIVSTLSDFTVSAWVKMDAISTWMRVFDLGNGSTQYMFLTVQAGTTTVNGVSNSIVRYGIKNGSPAEQNISANFVFPLSTWVHLAVTQSGTTTNLYINGTLAATKTGMTIKPSQLTPTGTTTGTSLNYLGKSQFNDPMFKGSIDEFKIYNRALSAAEIAGSMKSSQTITFSAFADKALGVADFDPAATASSGLTVTYTSSNTSVATIVNGMIHVLGAGTSTITAAQAGNTDYTAAPSITRILTVKNLQTINFPAIAQKVINDADFDAGATASSGLAISYTSSDGSVATIVNGKVHILGTGTATITATQAGNAGYLAAAPVSQNLTVKNPQTITFAALPVKGAGSADFNAGATTSSGLPVSYTSSDTTVATIVNGKIHLVGLGTTTITATQAGNVAWLPASSVSQTLLVTDQTPPVVKTTDVTLSLDASGNAVLTAARVDNGSSDNIGISSLTIDKTSFSCANIGSNTVTLTATDAAGNISSATATVTVQDTIVPRVITQNLIANLDANGNANVNPSQINNGSTDNCSIASYSLDKTSFDCTNIGANTVTLTVTDGSGNRSTATAVVLVQDKIAPVVPVLADITAECSATATAPTTADNCAGTVTGTTTDALTYTTQGTHVIHWSFSDGNGNVSTATQNVIIKDVTVPVVPVLADVTGECSATATVPSTTDNCAGTVDGTTTDPLTYNTQGTHVIHWSFSDGNGNISTATQNVIIKDVTAPAVPILADVTGECSATATAPTTTDNCAGMVTGTTSDALTYSTQGTHVIHWSFSDGNGNVSTAMQNVIVKDDIAPIVITQNITVQLDASGKASITPAQINNGSSDNCSIATYALNKSTFDCSNVGANNVTLTVTDASGNSSTATAIVTVQDNTAPTVVTQNITVNLDASGKATITEAQINNGSTDNCSIATYALDKKTFDCSNVGANTVTLTVTDASGNVSTGTAIVTVLDNTAPIVLTKNITVYLSGGKVTITPGQVDNGSNDACGIKSMSLSRTSFDCSSQGDNTVTLTVTDSHNNTAIGTAVVTVIGKTPAPTITVSRSDNTNTGLDANTIALGYGAQSLTLTATNSNSAPGASTYAWSPATGLSNVNVANPVFTPTQAGIYTFHVLVTSEYGCQASTTVTINVTDVRCGNNGDKVSVCHKTGSSNPYTQLCISPNAVPAQLANGGTLGACQYIQSTGTLSLASDVAAPSADTVNKVVDPQIMLKAYPNPFAQQTTVNFTVPVSDQKVSLDVYNIYGLLISHLYNGKAEAGQDYRFAFDGIRLLPGVYIVRLTTSKAVKNFKLILAK